MEDLIQQLFAKYLGGKCTGREIEILMANFNYPENELLLKQLILAAMESDHTDVGDVPDLEARLSVIQNNVQQIINKDRSTFTLWFPVRSIAAVAAILVVAGLALVYLTNREQPTVLVVNPVKNITPGTGSATLTLANGTKILLKDAAQGQIAKQAGVTITKMDNGRITYKTVPEMSNSTSQNATVSYNNLSTANGEQYTLILPDGSMVTLNAASSIKYPASFAGLKERKIELTGEAYFVVKHNHQQPFKVMSKGQEVEDIGTEFNINSYPDEQLIKTTLISGSARVTAGTTQAVTLTPSRQATLVDHSLKVDVVDPRIFTSWKDGSFAYKNTSLERVLRQVARWYNVKIVYQDQDLRSKRLTGSVSRYETITGILNAIAYTAKVRFKLEDRTITVLQEH